MNERAVPALMVGGAISAIIPQSIEETWRLSTMIVEAGLAPQALVGREPAEDAGDEAWKRWGKKGTSAVAIVMMSGAELGLPPMVALRSFTVIGGKPALYGDGLINVVRRSNKAAYLRTGFAKDDIEIMRRAGVLPTAQDEERNPGVTQQALARLSLDERTFGWCSAKRADNGEEKTVLFSIAAAKLAGLWDDRPTRRGKIWKNGKQEWGDVPNDSTWHRYSQRMQAWRAAGFCLRELFADVLGGIRDEFEAREIAGELIEHSDEPVVAKKLSPPSPPKPPSPDAPIDTIPDNGFDKDLNDVRDGDVVEDGEQGEEGEPFDFGQFFESFQIALAGAKDEAQVEEIWSEFDVEARFQDDADSRQLADRIKERRLAALNPLASG
jgi:hypothetical protein